MFGISSTELMVILVVALLVLGPKRLPEAARLIGRLARDLKSSMDDLRNAVVEEEGTKDVYSQAREAYDMAKKAVEGVEEATSGVLKETTPQQDDKGSETAPPDKTDENGNKDNNK